MQEGLRWFGLFAFVWALVGSATTQTSLHQGGFIFASGNLSSTASSDLHSNDLWVKRIQEQRERENQDKVLLPAHVLPLKYQITLQPHFGTFTFNGTEAVELNVVEPTNSVTLHASQLNITSAALHDQDGSRVRAVTILHDPKSMTATIQFPHTLENGQAKLVMNFEGLLNDQLNGFYRSSYIYEGQTKHLGVTQFQPADARKAFPCWDEPALKALFQISLVVEKELTCLSNTPIRSTLLLESGLKRVEFYETPLMSTYLVAFVVGHLEFIEANTAEGVQVRVYTPPGKQQAACSAERYCIAVRTLSYFHDYFGIAYPLPKLDLVSVPDFAAGAMENWGCSIFREALILVDQSSSLPAKQLVAYAVAHELAHQWFGNLVSPDWWDYLWLNEGFATWAGNMAVNHLFPEWDIWTKFVNEYSRTGLALDSLVSSHPVEVHVKEASDTREIFDAICYDKGASIMRMLASHLGEDVFSRALHNYLKEYTYGNAVTEDLWDSITELAGKPIDTLMNPWVKASGYPVLFIDHEVIDNEAFISVKQERFFSLPPTQVDEPNPIWWVPLSLFYSSNASHPVFLSLWENGKGVVERVRLPSEFVTIDNDEWIKANALQTGFFRVRYSKSLLNALQSPLLSMELSASDRLGLLDDAFSLCKAGYIATTDLLNFLQSYVNEDNLFVWTALTLNIESLRAAWRQFLSSLEAEEEYALMQTYIKSLYQPIIERLGWISEGLGEDQQQMILRSIVLSYGGGHGNIEEVIEEASRQFNEYLEDEQGKALHPDLSALVYSLAVKFGGTGEWLAVLAIYRNPKSEEQKIQAIKALGKSTNPELIRRTLELVLSEEMRAQDVSFVFASVGTNDAGIEVAWSFLKENWEEIERSFGNQFLALGRIVEGTTAYFSTERQVNELREFFANKEVSSISRTVQQVTEKARSRSIWMQRDAEAVLAWLRDNAKNRLG